MPILFPCKLIDGDALVMVLEVEAFENATSTARTFSASAVASLLLEAAQSTRLTATSQWHTPAAVGDAVAVEACCVRAAQDCMRSGEVECACQAHTWAMH